MEKFYEKKKSIGEVTQDYQTKLFNMFAIMQTLEENTKSNEMNMNNTWGCIHDTVKIQTKIVYSITNFMD